MTEYKQMAQNKMVSVIIPVYNTEKYLDKCIESVLCQSYTNLEIILVDDGSEDSSGKICDEYAARDDRIRVFHKKNGGGSSARNAGTRMVEGYYLYYMDSDDYIAPNAIGHLVDHIEEQKADFVYFDFVTLFEADNKIGYNPKTTHSKKHKTKDGFQILNNNLNHKEHYPVIYTHFFKKEFIIKNNLIFKKMIHEDDLFLTLAYLKAERVAYLNEVLYYRRFRAGSIMSGQVGTESLKGYNTCIREFYRMLDDYPQEDDRKKVLLSLIDEKANMVAWIYSKLSCERSAVKKYYFQTCRVLSKLDYCDDLKLKLKIKHPLAFELWNSCAELLHH